MSLAQVFRMRRSLRSAVSLVALWVTVIACSPRSSSEGPAAADSDKGAPATVPTSPSFAGTHWTLITLGDRDIVAASATREPHLTFAADSSRVSGSGGCNRVFGGYAMSGDSLSFSGVASTKMACATGMDIEAAFLPALSRVARWRIVDGKLELSDAAGTLVARFQAK
jgi:putative lipoprotein